MIKSDLELVETYFRECFPDTSKWLDELPEESKEKTREHWLRAWKNLQYTDARRAIEAIFRGEVDRPSSREREQWPSKIYRLAREYSSFRLKAASLKVYSETNPKPISCRCCEDAGYVYVWHAKTMHDAIANLRTGQGEVKYYECVVACTCERGTDRLSGCNNTRYNPEVMFRVFDEAGDRQTMDQFAAFCKAVDGKQYEFN